MDLESPSGCDDEEAAAKEFPGLYYSDESTQSNKSGKKSSGTSLKKMDGTDYDSDSSSKKKKDKKDKKDKGYATLAGESSPDEDKEKGSKSPGRVKKLKGFKLTSSSKKSADSSKESTPPKKISSESDKLATATPPTTSAAASTSSGGHHSHRQLPFSPASLLKDTKESSKKDKEQQKNKEKDAAKSKDKLKTELKAKLKLKRGSKNSLEQQQDQHHPIEQQISPVPREDPELITKEIKKVEGALENLHNQMKKKSSKKHEEQLWELQRTLTQLKRKLRSVNALSCCGNVTSVIQQQQGSTSTTIATGHQQLGGPVQVQATAPIATAPLPQQYQRHSIGPTSLVSTTHKVPIPNSTSQLMSTTPSNGSAKPQVVPASASGSVVSTSSSKNHITPATAHVTITTISPSAPVTVTAITNPINPPPPPQPIEVKAIIQELKPIIPPPAIIAEKRTEKSEQNKERYERSSRPPQQQIQSISTDSSDFIPETVEEFEKLHIQSKEAAAVDVQRIQVQVPPQPTTTTASASMEHQHQHQRYTNKVHVQQQIVVDETDNNTSTTKTNNIPTEEEEQEELIPKEIKRHSSLPNKSASIITAARSSSSLITTTNPVIYLPIFQTDEFISLENEALILFNQALQEQIIEEEKSIEKLIEQLSLMIDTNDGKLFSVEKEEIDDEDVVNVLESVKYENDTLHDQVTNLKALVAKAKLEEFQLELRLKYLQEHELLEEATTE